VTVAVPEAKGVLAQITRTLADQGANIVSVATYGGAASEMPRIMFKLNDVDPAVVRPALEKLNLTITDFRSI
jgi:uncharacterized protein with ACT and thioredoxin-like domain